MEPIQTAILSFGMSGQLFHAPFIHVHDGFRFHAVWERSKDLAKARYPEVITYRSLEELLADEQVELVIVNTPNATHFEYAQKSLEAGKHVIVEKPFTVTVEEGAELIRLATEKGLFLSVYQNRRYDSDYRIVRKVLEEGWLGNIVEAEFHFDRYKEELSPKVHKETPGPGAGILYDLGAHIIDQALQLFGMPQSVFGDIRIMRPAARVDDYFELLLYYPDKRVRLHASYLVREPLPAYILHGVKGSFLKNKTDVQEASLQQGRLPLGADWGMEPEHEKGWLHAEKDGRVIREHVASLKGNYGDYFEAIYQALRNQRPLPVPAAEGLDVIRVIRKAIESSDARKVVDL